jgi:hypothetical protein
MMAMQNKLSFDEGTHTYRLGDVVVPSVTQIIRAVLPGWEASDWYKQRGRAMHHGCRLLAAGKLDWSSVDEQILPRLKACEKFFADCKGYGKTALRPSLSEHALASKKYMFAGTLDLVLNQDTIVDYKSSIEPQVRVQLGGYSLLLQENYPDWPFANGFAVELRDNGSYGTIVLNKHELRRAAMTFLACLSVFNFKVSHNLKGNS